TVNRLIGTCRGSLCDGFASALGRKTSALGRKRGAFIGQRQIRLAVWALAPVFEGPKHRLDRNRIITVNQGIAGSFIESGAVQLGSLDP
ncbi:MAG: hypothetical protein NXI32_25500, partial [bacterium]|nr:hypothetical protein [bacterium]